MSEPPPLGAWEVALNALVQIRNLNAYALIIFGFVAWLLKMPDSISGGLILAGAAVLKSGG